MVTVTLEILEPADGLMYLGFCAISLIPAAVNVKAAPKLSVNVSQLVPSLEPCMVSVSPNVPEH